MDTFTFKNIAEGQRFKRINVATGTVLPNAPVCTKVKPFDRYRLTPGNCTFEWGGRSHGVRIPDDEAVALVHQEDA